VRQAVLLNPARPPRCDAQDLPFGIVNDDRGLIGERQEAASGKDKHRLNWWPVKVLPPGIRRPPPSVA